MKYEEYRRRLLNWWQSLTDEQKMVLPTANNTIDLRDLFSDAPISYYTIRRNLKEDVKKIEAELKVLGVLFDVDAYRERLLNWWQLLSDDQKKGLPTVNNTIDLRDLFGGVPLSYGSIRQYLQEDINKIDAELKALDVLFDVKAYKDRLLNWWGALTDEQKKALPTVKNTINLRDLFDGAPIGHGAIRQYLKEEIDKIDAELKALGAFFNVEICRKRLLNWWGALTDEQKKTLPTVNNTIDLRDFFSDAPISYYTIRKNLKEYVKKIDAELKALGVLFDVEAYRERLINWWGALTDEQKKTLPTASNTIDLRDLFDGVPLKYASIRQYLQEDIKKIDAELKALGILSDVEAYRERLINWWQSLTDAQKRVVPTINNTIDFRDLFSDAPTSYYTIRKNLKKDVKKIDTELKSLNILFDCEAYRELLLNYWQSLTDEQKKAVPTQKNTIDLRFLFSEAPINYPEVRKHLKEDIEKIVAELKTLGVLLNVDEEVVATLMCGFISECKANPDLLWDIELTSHMVLHSKVVAGDPDRYFEEFGLVSKAYLMNKFSCSSKSLDKPALLDLRKQLNQLLLNYEVSLPYRQIKDSSHAVGHDLNNRRMFLQWKNSLTYEEKQALPMLGNTIKQEAFSNVIPTEHGATKRPLLKTEYQRFSREVAELKGISTCYKTVKEREAIRKENALNKEESKFLAFIKLRYKKLVSIDDFSSKKGAARMCSMHLQLDL
ncbi:hypothetical protein [Psychromonas sp. GE-S-Ul-11]|uniref:hypothetical protein n=1 Tax=Psychromonas sp. GE-S-Ul-11 TaxID=3241170 RepID=UPI00390CB97F